jgi:hypothetical protein
MPRLTERTRLATAIALALVGTFAARPAVAETESAGSGSVQGNEKSALTFREGDHGNEVELTVKAAAVYFMQNDAWFGNAQATQNLGVRSGSWWETYIHPGVEGGYVLENSSSLYGRVSGVFASTNEIDAAGSNIPWRNVTGTRVEDAYAGWRSGDLFGSLGKDFLDVSVGRRQYVAGNGFLFFSESSNGQNRGAYWMGERQAAKVSGIVKLESGHWKSDLIYLEADDNPNSNTRLGGITLDYSFGAPIGGIGGGIYTLASDIETRDSMDVLDVRFSLFPFEALEAADLLEPVKLEGEYVHEDNGHLVDDSGWYLSVGYQWAEVPWKPTLTYRYASFSENYDPLFYGFYDWGYWYQGEVLGEYVLSNSNLDSHMLKLNLKPVESLSASVFYYKFKFHDAGAAGVTSRDFADEWDLIVDWTPTAHVTISAVAAYVSPDEAAKELTGGDDDWSYGMLYGSVSF